LSREKVEERLSFEKRIRNHIISKGIKKTSPFLERFENILVKLELKSSLAV